MNVVSLSSRSRQVHSPAAPAHADGSILGTRVALLPLDPAHAEGLFAAAADPRVWRWMRMPGFATLDETRDWIDRALGSAERGFELPYTLVRTADGRIVGSTRFLELRPEERSAEIGWTWLAPEFQRTGLNLEAKYLMLRLAFEEWKLLRIAFLTHEENGPSRASLVRLGAVYEGTLRLHRCGETRRNSALYSIIAPEWPKIRSQIELRLRRRSRP